MKGHSKCPFIQVLKVFTETFPSQSEVEVVQKHNRKGFSPVASPLISRKQEDGPLAISLKLVPAGNTND